MKKQKDRLIRKYRRITALILDITGYEGEVSDNTQLLCLLQFVPWEKGYDTEVRHLRDKSQRLMGLDLSQYLMKTLGETVVRIANKDKGLKKYEGIIETYYETGMECMGIIFHSNTGNHEGPDPSNPQKTMTFRSLEHAVFFNKRGTYNVKVFDKNGITVEYDGPLTYSREKIIEKEYAYSFLPKEVDCGTFIKWAAEERKMQLETDDIIMALE